MFSCAYFENKRTRLEEAQDAKLDYVLRKLNLSRGEKFLDIGCGWGALVVRAARQFGTTVTGITISQSQVEEARRQITQAKVSSSAKVILGDFIKAKRLGRFDKIASLEVFEHVGRQNLPDYFQKAHALLKPGGLFLNHGMSYQNLRANGDAGQMYRPFPGTELVALPEMLASAADVGFEIRDVENLREHYVRTFTAWSDNLKKHRNKIVAAVADETYNVSLQHLLAMARSFDVGELALFQVILAKPDRRGHVSIPQTREGLYVRNGRSARHSI